MTSCISPDHLERVIRAQRFVPDALADELSRQPEFKAAFSANVGVLQSYTLRTHTLRVLDCYEKHYAPREQDRRRKELFRVFLALHDIGKPRAIEAGDKRMQHRFTVEMMRQTRDAYPVTDREFEDWIALVDGDPVGSFLKNEIPQEAAAGMIRGMAVRSSLSPQDFYRQLIVYYQCDASAYTRRAGLMTALDELFEWDAALNEIQFDEKRGLLKFSNRVQQQMGSLSPEALWGARP